MEKQKLDELVERLNLLETRIVKYSATTPNLQELIDILRQFIFEVTEDMKNPSFLERKDDPRLPARLRRKIAGIPTPE